MGTGQEAILRVLEETQETPPAERTLTPGPSTLTMRAHERS